jgi:hypothetical protein
MKRSKFRDDQILAIAKKGEALERTLVCQLG